MANGICLEWDGKRSAPAALNPQPGFEVLEQIGAAETSRGRILYGDNLLAMAALKLSLDRPIDLIYIDPPFFSGRDWMTRGESSTGRTSERPRKGKDVAPAGGMDDVVPGSSEDSPEPRDHDQCGAGTLFDSTAFGDEILNVNGIKSKLRSAGIGGRQVAFRDGWDGDLPGYLQWLFDRLTYARDLLAETGSLYLHLNWVAAHYGRLILDEVFGPDRFQNEIAWCYREAINSRRRWNRKHDTILFYSKSEKYTFNPDSVLQKYSESNVKKYRHKDDTGVYRLMGRGITDSPLRSKRDLPPEYEVLYPGLTYRHYLGAGTLPVDYWQIDIENQASVRRTGYPTQKPEALMERIILASSNEGDLVADFCCGSGTTLSVSERLGRHWIGCDAGVPAIETTWKRLRELKVHRPGVGVGSPSFTVEEVV